MQVVAEPLMTIEDEEDKEAADNMILMRGWGGRMRFRESVTEPDRTDGLTV